MVRIPRRRLVAMTVWLLVGAAGAFAARRIAQRPENPRADAITLQPKSGGYGPVNLSIIQLGPAPNADGHTALLMVSAGGTDSLIVGLPTLTYAPAGAATVQLSSEPLTERALSKRLLGAAEPADPAAHAEAAELLDLMRVKPGEGLSTRVRHFRLVEAKPWNKPWWLRRARPVYWVALWLASGAWLWRWAGGSG